VERRHSVQQTFIYGHFTVILTTNQCNYSQSIRDEAVRRFTARV